MYDFAVKFSSRIMSETEFFFFFFRTKELSPNFYFDSERI